MDNHLRPEASGPSDSFAFGKYRIVGTLDGGGMANVYLTVARGPLGFNKLQVVKRLKPHLQSDPEFVAMFVDEARIGARLNHPSIVQTNEVGEQDGVYFLAMEYLEGQTLRRLIRENTRRGGQDLSLRVHLRILSDVLSGLDHAHRLTGFDGRPLGLVHRDVTPDNVIVTYDGCTKLLDFGIAKATTNVNQTRAGVLKGKVKYMAPEQIASQNLTHHADIYAVGVMLWEALAGRHMWRKVEERIVVRSVLTGEIPSLVAANPDAPPELVEACTRALRSEPQERFADAAEFQAVIDAYLDKQERVSPREVGGIVASLFAGERTRIRGLVDEQLAAISAAADHMASPIQLGLPSSGSFTPLSSAAAFGESSGPFRRYTSSSSPSGSSQVSVPSAAEAPLPAPPRQKRWRKWAIFGSVALVACGGGVSLLVARSAPAPVGVAASPPPPAVAQQEPPAPTPAATVVTLNARATPGNCRLFFDEAPLAGNPFVGSFPKDGALHKIRAEAPGYESKSMLVSLDRDVNLDLDLAVHRAPVGVPRAAPVAPVATPSPADEIPVLSSKASKAKDKPKLDTID